MVALRPYSFSFLNQVKAFFTNLCRSFRTSYPYIMNIKPFKLERYYTVNEFAAKYSLCNSDSESMKISDLLSFEKDAKDKFHNLWLGYTESKGHPELRCDIASIYSAIPPENLLVCTGAQEPIFLFSQANLSAHDEVIDNRPVINHYMLCPKVWVVKFPIGT